MHRVFCATPWEMEAERLLFHEVVGKVNEERGLSKRLLFIPVALPCVVDKRPFAYTLEQNIRECRYFIAALSGDWGPKERNFHPDYLIAQECKADPAAPMEEAVVFLRTGPADPPPIEGLPEPEARFSTTAEFGRVVETLLNRWFDSMERELAGPDSPRAADA